MATATVHPLFEKHASHQWTGKLPDLFQRLLSEARKQPDNGWAWRVLRGGAVVGVRLHPKELRFELKIARQEPADTPEKLKKFDAEVGTFLNQFGIHAVDGTEPAESDNDWLTRPLEPEDEGKAVARFLQLREGEIEPGKARCDPCHRMGVAKTVEWFPGGGVTGQACMAHAMVAGRKHAEEVRARTRG